MLVEDKQSEYVLNSIVYDNDTCDAHSLGTLILKMTISSRMSLNLSLIPQEWMNLTAFTKLLVQLVLIPRGSTLLPLIFHVNTCDSFIKSSSFGCWNTHVPHFLVESPISNMFKQKLNTFLILSHFLVVKSSCRAQEEHWVSTSGPTSAHHTLGLTERPGRGRAVSSMDPRAQGFIRQKIGNLWFNQQKDLGKVDLKIFEL